MQPLTTKPAGALTQMGSQNTHLAGIACTTKVSALQKVILFFWVPPFVVIFRRKGGGEW